MHTDVRLIIWSIRTDVIVSPLAIVFSVLRQIHLFQSMFCIIYIMETFPLEFFDLISNFDFL